MCPFGGVYKNAGVLRVFDLCISALFRLDARVARPCFYCFLSCSHLGTLHEISVLKGCRRGSLTNLYYPSCRNMIGQCPL